MAPGFELLEHTADIGIRARGRSPSEAFEQATQGFFHLMYDPEQVQPTIERNLEVRAEGYEYVLHDFLNELVYLFDAEKLAFSQIEILELSPEQLRATLRGERFDPSRHDGRVYVKAVTLHQLKFEAQAGEWIAVIYLDI
jgi:SHS2 domain-containing protein